MFARRLMPVVASLLLMIAAGSGCRSGHCERLEGRLCSELGDAGDCEPVGRLLERELGEVPSAVRRRVCEIVVERPDNIAMWVELAKKAGPASE